mmetsp:Transcript_11919/g.34404  ORF Transcript_11919/g.34404 Transcript_11919/m.34404 type:complete len:273 (-) Transcript_11919:2821-3639(-)
MVLVVVVVVVAATVRRSKNEVPFQGAGDGGGGGRGGRRGSGGGRGGRRVSHHLHLNELPVQEDLEETEDDGGDAQAHALYKRVELCGHEPDLGPEGPENQLFHELGAETVELDHGRRGLGQFVPLGEALVHVAVRVHGAHGHDHGEGELLAGDLVDQGPGGVVAEVGVVDEDHRGAPAREAPQEAHHEPDQRGGAAGPRERLGRHGLGGLLAPGPQNRVQEEGLPYLDPAVIAGADLLLQHAGPGVDLVLSIFGQAPRPGVQVLAHHVSPDL